MKNSQNIKKNPLGRRPQEDTDQDRSGTRTPAEQHVQPQGTASFEEMYADHDVPVKMRKLTVRITEDDYQLLRDIKHDHEVTTQDVLSTALREYMRNHYNK